MDKYNIIHENEVAFSELSSDELFDHLQDMADEFYTSGKYNPENIQVVNLESVHIEDQPSV